MNGAMISPGDRNQRFTVSLLALYDVSEWTEILEKEFSMKYGKKEITIKLLHQKTSIEHHNPPDSRGYIRIDINLIQFLLTIDLGYKYFIKKYQRYRGSFSVGDIERSDNFRNYAVCHVLRNISFEIINSFLDRVRIFYAKPFLPPLSSNITCDIRYSTKREPFTSDKSIIINYQDNRIANRNIVTKQKVTPERIEDFSKFIQVKNTEISSLFFDIINAYRLLQNGYYNQAVSQIINCLHAYIDLLISQKIKNKAFLKNFAKNPEKYNSEDKTTWIFNFIANMTLKELISKHACQITQIKSPDKLYGNYKKYRKRRNAIAHPQEGKMREVNYKEAHEACETVVHIIILIRKFVEKLKGFDWYFETLLALLSRNETV